MRKEIVFATIAGLLIGSVFAFGVYRANQALDKPTDAIFGQENNPSPTPTATPQTPSIVISHPVEGELQTEEQIEVLGLAQPNSYVIISTEDSDYLSKSDANGGFEQVITLIPGLNPILVASLDQSGVISQALLYIVYSQAFESESDSVEDRIEEATNPLNVVMGNITDIAEDTIQITDSSGKVHQLSTIPETTSYVDLSDNSSEISYDDLAIDDFIIAIGTLQDQSVMESSRILVTEPPQEIDREVFFGTVIESERRFVNIQLPESESLSVNTSRNLVVFDGKDENIEMADIPIDATIFTSGVIDEGELYARIIQVVSAPVAETTESES